MTPIPYGKQTISEEDIHKLTEALKSDFLTTGPKVMGFEEKFAQKVGAKYAVAVSNGTAALHLACLAGGLEKEQELITSPISFVASANCALYCDARPVFVDINEHGLIDEDLIEEKITSRTKIIIPVHYMGLPCNMKRIKEIAQKYNLIVIEDACHALGAKYVDSQIGDCKYSEMTCFSFHPVKHITTGEGGMITTNSQELYKKLLMLRNHGITKEYKLLKNQEEGTWHQEMISLGFNYRLTDLQCALGISQLNKLDLFVNIRREIAKKYDSAFESYSEVEIIPSCKDRFNSYHLYVIKVKDKSTRLKLFNYLKDNGVNCQVHYLPIHWQPYYQKLGYSKSLCPKSGEFYERIISLPIYSTLSEEEQDKVIEVIKRGSKMNETTKEINKDNEEATTKEMKEKEFTLERVKEETNTFIFKYQKEDVNEKLSKIFGNKFRNYREEFDKTQNYLETNFIPDFPLTISLELVNKCNLNCVMCYKEHHAKPRNELSLEVLKKIMQECKENNMPSVILGLAAETLMYKDINEVLDIIRAAGTMDLFFGTNGVMLNEEIIKKIIDNKVSRVEISLDAATPETYQKVRGHDKLDKIEKNIEMLLEYKKKHNTPLPIIRLCFVIMDINRHETQQFINKWKDKVDYIDFQRCLDFSKIDTPAEIQNEKISNAFCAQPFYSLNIWANGDVSPCCTFYGEKLVIGNVHKQSLKSIWEGTRMKEIREQISSKHFNPICQRCLYFRDDENINQCLERKE